MLPDGTTVQDRRFKDGSSTRTTTNPDKSVEVFRTTSDGKGNGTSEISYSDGTRIVTTNTHDADGTQRTTTVGRDGVKSETTSRTETQPDGTSVTRATTPDGSVSTVTSRPNGNSESETRHANGEVERSQTEKLADGSRTTHTGRDGKVTIDEDHYDDATKTRTAINTGSDGVQHKTTTTDTQDADGTRRSVTTSDHSVTTHVSRPDGSSETTNNYADGTSDRSETQVRSDGSMSITSTDATGRQITNATTKNDDGSVTTTRTDSQGTNHTHTMQPDGGVSSITNNADGSSDRVNTDAYGSGNAQHQNADGTTSNTNLDPDPTLVGGDSSGNVAMNDPFDDVTGGGLMADTGADSTVHDTPDDVLTDGQDATGQVDPGGDTSSFDHSGTGDADLGDTSGFDQTGGFDQSGFGDAGVDNTALAETSGFDQSSDTSSFPDTGSDSGAETESIDAGGDFDA